MKHGGESKNSVSNRSPDSSVRLVHGYRGGLDSKEVVEMMTGQMRPVMDSRP